MRKILITLFVVLFTGSFTIHAQKSVPFNFEKTAHNFGRIKEDGGKVTHTFKFKNNGKQPIIIKNVQSSCGCTTPGWSKKPVVPGQSGFVSAEFDPRNRPGNFGKQIKVYNNITSTPITLEIKGDVIPKTKKVTDIYRHKIGDLRLKKNHVAFARINNTQTKSQSVEIINDSENIINIGFNEKNIKDHLKIIAVPKTLKPKQTGKITVTYNATKKNSWGYVIDRIPLLLNGKPAPGYPLSISATIIEDFSKLSKTELANAPTMDFENTTFNFGKVKQGKKIPYEFKFKNNGKRDLIIRQTKASCGCTAVENKKVIKPGESSSIKVVFNTAGKTGTQNKSITLISNIPEKEKYKTLLRVKGLVEK